MPKSRLFLQQKREKRDAREIDLGQGVGECAVQGGSEAEQSRQVERGRSRGSWGTECRSDMDRRGHRRGGGGDHGLGEGMARGGVVPGKSSRLRSPLTPCDPAGINDDDDDCDSGNANDHDRDDDHGSDNDDDSDNGVANDNGSGKDNDCGNDNDEDNDIDTGMGREEGCEEGGGERVLLRNGYAEAIPHLDHADPGGVEATGLEGGVQVLQGEHASSCPMGAEARVWGDEAHGEGRVHLGRNEEPGPTGAGGGNRRGHGRRCGITRADAEAAEATLIAKGAPPPTTDSMMMSGHDRITASFNKKRGSTPSAGSCVKRHRPTRIAAVTTRVEVVIEPLVREGNRPAREGKGKTRREIGHARVATTNATKKAKITKITTHGTSTGNALPQGGAGGPAQGQRGGGGGGVGVDTKAIKFQRCRHTVQPRIGGQIGPGNVANPAL